MSGKRRCRDQRASRSYSENAKRTLSALVLAAMAGVLTYSGLWPFTVMIAAASAVLAWEWGRLVRGEALDGAFYVHGAATIAACICAGMGSAWLAMLALGAGALAAAFTSGSPGTRLWSALGVIYLGVPAILLVFFRSDAAFGVSAIFFLFLVVWSADIAAYFTGRTIGGAKLAPVISPGKTWSGLVGGLALPTMLAYGFALWLGGTWAPGLALLGAGLALACQIGDLTESAIKRKFHAKDSGQLLPGHGGLFDRVDGMIGTALAAGCIAVARGFPEPGRALLMWP